MSGIAERLADNWLVFHEHYPAGAYLPTGQLDGDCHSCGEAWPCSSVLPVVEREIAAARGEALREAADAWTQGGWADAMLPKPTHTAAPVIAYSNRIGDWLRDRAALSPDPDRGEDCDWRPMSEDVSLHTMGRYVQHHDGRACAFHHRLGVWVFGQFPTTECLRVHDTQEAKR